MIAIVNEARLVGCELEMYGLVTDRQLLDVLSRCGIEARMCSYSENGSGVHNVAIKYDGSISAPSGDGLSWRCYELTWKMYPNRAGYDFTTKLCSILTTLGMKVNTSCGFHVHVDARDYTVDNMKALYNLCFKYENVIAGMLPAGSRGRSYAKLREGRDQRVFARARCLEHIYQMAGDRRYGLNFQSYFKTDRSGGGYRKTIEFRYHSPTVDRDKVWQWCMLCLRMVEHAKVRQCSSKTKLPNTSTSLRNFVCAIGLKPNNKIYTTIDARLRATRDHAISRWHKFSGGRRSTRGV